MVAGAVHWVAMEEAVRGRKVACMFLIWKRSGERAQVRFFPGCLIWSIVLSVALTILLNLLIRAF